MSHCRAFESPQGYSQDSVGGYVLKWQKSNENDIKHGFYLPTPEAGQLYSNFQVWATKIREAFDPEAV